MCRTMNCHCDEVRLSMKHLRDLLKKYLLQQYFACIFKAMLFFSQQALTGPAFLIIFIFIKGQHLFYHLLHASD